MIKKLAIMAVFAMVCWSMQAQNPPHPNGGNDPGSGNTPVGGGAPIDGGLIVMLIAGAAYASKKTFQPFKQK